MSYHFGEHFWWPSRWQGQKFNFQVILYDFLDGQDPFTKSGGHARPLRLEVWNFAWDLVWPIHMPYKNRGSIREKKIIFGHPIKHYNIFISRLSSAFNPKGSLQKKTKSPKNCKRGELKWKRWMVMKVDWWIKHVIMFTQYWGYWVLNRPRKSGRN